MGVVSQAAQRIRYAAHGLVAAWADHDRRSAELLRRVADGAVVVARIVDPVRPGGPALSAAVRSQASLGATAASSELAAVSALLSDETRALLALLFDDPGLSGVATVLPPPGSGDVAIIGTFPPGPPRDYVRHILTDHGDSWVQPLGTAQVAGVTGPAAPPASIGALAEQFDPSLRADVARMFAHPRSHAIQVHGPDVPDEALQARITWRKDPAGRTTPQHRWTVNPDDTVATRHQVGAAAGRYNTFEALAKPLKVLIEQNGGTIEGLDTYLSDLDPDRVSLFVPAKTAGLEHGDTTGFRGSGTRTRDMERHWRRARDYAMDTGSAPMPVIGTDQIADGPDPGAVIIFQKIDGDWVVITAYPSAYQPDDFARFGGSTS